VSNEFQIRLYNFEISPPATAWDKILVALDQPPVTEEFPSRLYDLQLTPPPGLWQKINSALNKLNELKTPVPFINRIKPYYRYAAAAVMVGVITFLISIFINKQNIANVAEDKIIPGKLHSLPLQKTIDQNNNQKQEATVLTNQLPEPNKKRLIAATITNHGKSIEELLQNKLINTPINYSSPATLQTSYSADNLENDAEYLDYSPRAITYDQSKISRINNYIVLLRPDGNIMRVSKKFVDMIGCMYTSPSNSSDENCHEQIKTWRKKMAKSLVTPSQDNFMDILTLIKSLQDN
jgi:hypothetical protein